MWSKDGWRNAGEEGGDVSAAVYEEFLRETYGQPRSRRARAQEDWIKVLAMPLIFIFTSLLVASAVVSGRECLRMAEQRAAKRAATLLYHRLSDDREPWAVHLTLLNNGLDKHTYRRTLEVWLALTTPCPWIP